MNASYSPAQRRALADAVRKGEQPRCPACGALLARHEIGPKRELAYVRRRVLLICPACKRSVAVDAGGAGGPATSP